jgi:small subunit ribosomal protein S4
MVSHGHVTVNGRKTNTSSMNVKAGDKIAVRSSDRSKRLALKAVDQTSAISTPEWLVADKDNLAGTVVRIPTRGDINPIVNEQLVVELYSREQAVGLGSPSGISPRKPTVQRGPTA